MFPLQVLLRPLGGMGGFERLPLDLALLLLHVARQFRRLALALLIKLLLVDDIEDTLEVALVVDLQELLGALLGPRNAVRICSTL